MIGTLTTELQRILAEAILRLYNLRIEDIGLAFPPEVTMGDFAFPCFFLAKTLKCSPAEVAKALAGEISSSSLLSAATAAGPYLNLTLDRAALFTALSREAAQGKFQIAQSGEGQTILVEYVSPNTNKPLHLGHLRNGCLGMAVANLLAASGYKVVKANLVNDRGAHICKSMLAWQRWFSPKTPESIGIKGDHFVGDCYVRFNQELKEDPSLEDEILKMLALWEEGDKETIALWRTMNDWVLKGFEESFRTFGFKFDVLDYESQTYKLGRDIVDAGLASGIFQYANDGSIYAELPETKTEIVNGKETTVKYFGLDPKRQSRLATVRRADGTSLYLTQDLGTATMRYDRYNFSRCIYVVGDEQVEHFAVLFYLLGELGYDWAKDCYHLAYGMVDLPSGKMKSREGDVVDADDLYEEMCELAEIEYQKRNASQEISPDELRERKNKIALGAIKFFLLQVNPRERMTFDPKKSITFDGFTGPYCQYTYARACGIIDKAKAKKLDPAQADFSALGNEEEMLLARKLLDWPAQVERAAGELNPAKLAVALYELAKSFNQFYQKHSVINAEEKLAAARLALVQTVIVALKQGHELLNIPVIENM